jgi:transposase
MSYLKGPDRSQVELLPPCLEEYVAANSPVRFIEAFVCGLDVASLGFERSQPAATGRPGYDPADLLKLYLYGYLNRIRSSRRLEAEAGRNVEVLWLLRRLAPDFKTIADFRKDNRKCFQGVFRQFNLLCRKLDLFGAELVAIDGSKFKAVNHPARHYGAEQLQQLAARVDERIEQYLQQLDQRDAEAQGVAGAPSPGELQAKLLVLREHKGKYDQLLGQLSASGQQEVSLTDADSRAQKRVGVGYNVQVAVDAKHDLIVETEVVQDANDRNQLSALAIAAQTQLGVAHLKAVADSGYDEVDQFKACADAGIEVYVPAQGTTSGQTKTGARVFPKEAFKYDPVRDLYECPAGRELRCETESLNKGRLKMSYYHRLACPDCPLKPQCTTGAFRKLGRAVNEAQAALVAARVKAHPEIVAERKTIVEHVFGTLRNWGHDTFLTRGLASVRAEFSLSALTYNLRRVLRLVGVEALLAFLQPAKLAETA